eukprot:XP_011678531.1 PREDICTED: low-density lipoprotein receptor-related protein 8-like [Strongylocentrotus purpuratus]
MASLCQPVRGPKGEMIPTKPTSMPYFPFHDNGKDIKHVMCTLSERSVKIFVTDPAAKSIFVADLQDDLIFSAIPSSSQPHDISYDSVTRKLYWSDKTDNRVYRADINGLNRENVTHLNSQIRGPKGEMIPTKPTSMPYFPFQDNGKDIKHVMCTLSERSVKIFVTDPAAKSIFVADLQDDLIFSAIPSSSQPHDISYDSVTRKLYWSDKTDNRVYRADINGLNRENVTHLNSQKPFDIAIAEASRTLYILYKDSDKVTSMSIGRNIPGNESDFITEGINGPRSIAIDETQGYVYVSMRVKSYVHL